MTGEAKLVRRNLVWRERLKAFVERERWDRYRGVEVYVGLFGRWGFYVGWASRDRSGSAIESALELRGEDGRA